MAWSSLANAPQNAAGNRLCDLRGPILLKPSLLCWVRDDTHLDEDGGGLSRLEHDQVIELMEPDSLGEERSPLPFHWPCVISGRRLSDVEQRLADHLATRFASPLVPVLRADEDGEARELAAPAGIYPLLLDGVVMDRRKEVCIR